MRLLVLYVLVILIHQSQQASSTYLYFDQAGIQNFTQAIVQKGSLSNDIQMDVDSSIDLKVGTLSVKGLKISEINLNGSDFQINLDERYNALVLDVKAQSFVVTTYVEFKVFGFTVGKGNLNIRIEGTTLGASITLGQREDNGALTIALKNDKVDKFKFGKICFIKVKSWWRKTIAFISTPVINLVVKLLQGKLSGVIENAIKNIGQSIPADLVLSGPFQGVTIPLNVTQAPSIGRNQARFDFVCGNTEIDDPVDVSYVRLGVSQQCIQGILNQIFALNPSPVNVSAIAQQISEVTEINTKTLSGLFPGFRQVDIPQDLKIEVTLNYLDQPLIEFNDGVVYVQAPMNLRLYLIQSQELSNKGFSLTQRINILLERSFQEQYYTEFNVTGTVQVGFVKAAKGYVISLEKMDTSNFQLAEEDRVSVDNWDDIKAVGLSFAMSYANQVLYQQMISLGFLDMDQANMESNEGELTISYDV